MLKKSNNIEYDVEDAIIIVPCENDFKKLEESLWLENCSKYIWSIIDGSNINDIVESVCSTYYNVNKNEAKNDIEIFIKELTQRKVISKIDE